MKRDEFDNFAEQSWTDSLFANLVPRFARDERPSPVASNLTSSAPLYPASSLSPSSQQESGFSPALSRATLSRMNSLNETQLSSCTIDSPVGALSLVASNLALIALVWRRDSHRSAFENAVENPNHPLLLETARQLREYFSASRRTFDLPLEFHGTDFQRRAWSALLTIPYGETRSYGQMAEQIGSPTAVRAIGAANGRNPISIIAPCHRVIGMNGDLTGFGGGLDAKAYLLSLEAPQKQLLAG
jgi:methylated-DNA-[protein]-cysteine S-methyltransferase